MLYKKGYDKKVDPIKDIFKKVGLLPASVVWEDSQTLYASARADFNFVHLALLKEIESLLSEIGYETIDCTIAQSQTWRGQMLIHFDLKKV